MLKISVFVSNEPVGGTEARALKAVRAVAARFPGQISVEVLPIDGELGTQLGLRTSPTVMEGDMILSVGEPLSAGRLKRYVEARLQELEAP